MIHSIDTGYEQAERDMLVSLAHPGDVLIDVGAYVGWYSVDFAGRVPKSKVMAFEPIPENRRELDKNAAGKNVTIYPLGLSDEPGIAEFYISSREPGTASLAPLEEDRFGPVSKVNSLVDTLDNILLFPEPNFIKIDVEGAELMVLKGARKTIEMYHPIILCEMLRKWCRRFNYHPNDIIDFLAGFGYRCFTIREGNLEPFGRVTDDTVERNFFFSVESL